ncbi:hypothetical protein R50073_12850 [Maricurvus nonylphenolicus]
MSYEASLLQITIYSYIYMQIHCSSEISTISLTLRNNDFSEAGEALLINDRHDIGDKLPLPKKF